MTANTVIRGYASAFNQRFYPACPHAILVRPGAFQLDSDVQLLIDHDDRHVFAATGQGGFRLWQDAYGLAFEVDVDTDMLDRLARDVANRERDAVSAAYAQGRQARFETTDGERLEIVERTRIDEVSILSCGACPNARAWLAIAGRDCAPYDLQNLALRWRAGHQQHIAAQHRAKAKATAKRPPPRKAVVPPSVVAMMDTPWFTNMIRTSPGRGELRAEIEGRRS